jgi:hypothetical protein
MTNTTPHLTIPGSTYYPRPMPTDPKQLARDRERLAKITPNRVLEERR